MNYLYIIFFDKSLFEENQHNTTHAYMLVHLFSTHFDWHCHWATSAFEIVKSAMDHLVINIIANVRLNFSNFNSIYRFLPDIFKLCFIKGISFFLLQFSLRTCMRLVWFPSVQLSSRSPPDRCTTLPKIIDCKIFLFFSTFCYKCFFLSDRNCLDFMYIYFKSIIEFE